ncbi:MAG TPA: hypothetical protein PLO50_10030 [Nitrospira sp.]|nr:hypothetical protein [Nitrospira sp.]
MSKKQTGLHLPKILKLLDDADFIRESGEYWDEYKAHERKIVSTDEQARRQAWDCLAEEFMRRVLDPFLTRWLVYPLPEALLSPLIRQRTQDAIMKGRWGLISVYPWTTKQEVTHKLKKIQDAIGKMHQDLQTARMALIAQWMEGSLISTNTNRHPSRSEIAAVVWGRKKGLNRPSKKKAIADISEERESALIQKHIAKGKTHQEAERLVFASLRGNEAPAAAMVRMALKRLNDWKSISAVTDPLKGDRLALTVTLLLKALLASDSSLQTLSVIRDRASDLGRLLLLPETIA